MAPTETTQTPAGQQENTAPKVEICPHCGHQLYSCECTNRWEDEGGTPLPADDAP